MSDRPANTYTIPDAISSSVTLQSQFILNACIGDGQLPDARSGLRSAHQQLERALIRFKCDPSAELWQQAMGCLGQFMSECLVYDVSANTKRVLLEDFAMPEIPG